MQVGEGFKCCVCLLCGFVGFFVEALNAVPLKPEVRKYYEELRSETLASMESMRDPSTALIGDKTIWTQDFKQSSNNGVVASTNVALDLILLVQQNTPHTEVVISRIVNELAKVEKFKVGGAELFYWGYKKNGQGFLEIFYDEVSSIDNFHLALSLWLVSQKHSATATREMASKLYQKIKLDSFVNAKTQLIHGAFKRNLLGVYELTAFTYSDWGSETRSLYVLGPALGLISNLDQTLYSKNVVQNLNVECTSLDGIGTAIKTWDGGTFQYFLPELLFGESQYSAPMAETFKSVAELALSYKSFLKVNFLPGFSASQRAVREHELFKDEDIFSLKTASSYSGVSGFFPLMVLRNQSNHNALEVESVTTPHASVMLSSVNPNRFMKDIEAMKTVVGVNGALHKSGFGFMDGYHLRGSSMDVVVPVQLALDQGMIALSAEKILSLEGHGVLALTLRDAKNSRGLNQIKNHIDNFYQNINPKLKIACNSVGASITDNETTLSLD